jgi:hypothetical protein
MPINLYSLQIFRCLLNKITKSISGATSTILLPLYKTCIILCLMKKHVLLPPCLSLLLSCTDEPGNVHPDRGGQPAPTEENRSAKGEITYTGSVQMEDGPHDLLVHNTSLFAVRDHRVFLFQLRNPAKPVLQVEATLRMAYSFIA